jgi:flagellar basal-body rod modification protein FlgD
MMTANVSAITSSGSTKATTTNEKVMGKDDFLRLLIAKLANQDPMNPVQDEDFAAQLAQFSSLEQLSNMNQNLTQDMQWNYLLSQTISNTMATSLIGRTIRADASQVFLPTNGAADVALHLDRPATDVTITIKDANGNAVRTIAMHGVDQGDQIVNWDGASDDGTQQVSGLYSVTISATDGNGNVFTPSQFVQGKVSGVTYKDGIALLSIDGQLIPLAMVLEVKEG